MPTWRGEEGPRWRITIAPGMVKVGTKDYARANAALERAAARKKRDVDWLVQDDGMTLMAPARARTITDWSTKSRNRMMWRFASLDYSTLFTEEAQPALITLTLPHEWESVAGTAAQFKEALDRWTSYWKYAWGERPRGIWKMEFQYRVACAAEGCHDPRAPHLHLLTVPPTGQSKGGLDFEAWLSKSWAQAVRHRDPEQRRLHELAGTSVDVEKTLRYGDALRIAFYFSKHGRFSAKDYQNVMPEAWRAAEEGGARFWGYWGLKAAEGTIETDAEIAAWVARHLRHLVDSEQRTRTEEVWRSKPLTSEETAHYVSTSARGSPRRPGGR